MLKITCFGEAKAYGACYFIWAPYQGRLSLADGVNEVIRNTSIHLRNCMGENIKNLAHVKNDS